MKDEVPDIVIPNLKKIRKIQFRFNPRKDIILINAALEFSLNKQSGEMWEHIAGKLRQEQKYNVTPRTCRLRIKHLFDHYKMQNLIAICKSGTEEEYDQRETLLKELLEHMDSQTSGLDDQPSSPEAENSRSESAVSQYRIQNFYTDSQLDIEEFEAVDELPRISNVFTEVTHEPGKFSKVLEIRKRTRDSAEEIEEREEALNGNSIDESSGIRKQKSNSYFHDEELRLEKDKFEHLKMKDMKELELEAKRLELKANKMQMKSEKQVSKMELEMRKIQLEQDRMRQQDRMMEMMSSIMQLVQHFVNKT